MSKKKPIATPAPLRKGRGRPGARKNATAKPLLRSDGET